MLTALLGAGLLCAIFALSIRHMPSWLKQVVLWIPAWIQSLAFHFGYAVFIGGVTGHMMGAPLAIIWYFLYVYWLKDELIRDVARDPADRRSLIKEAVVAIRGWFTSLKSFFTEVGSVVQEQDTATVAA